MTKLHYGCWRSSAVTIIPEFQRSSKSALITGITGQDDSCRAELLLAQGYEVHGIVWRVALEDPDHRVVQDVHPEECYHLAAQSFVSYSFDDEFSTLNTSINGTHYLPATLKSQRPECCFYFAGSSEMFGSVEFVPQDEGTRFHPRSTSASSKVAGFDLTRNYREDYGMRLSY